MSGGKGAAGVFAGFGEACAAADESVEQGPLDIARAVDGEFDGVFARERMRPAEDCGDTVVEDVTVGVGDVAEAASVARGVGEGFAAPDAVGYGDCSRTAEAYDGYAADARRSRDGADGVVIDVLLHDGQRFLRCQVW